MASTSSRYARAARSDRPPGSGRPIEPSSEIQLSHFEYITVLLSFVAAFGVSQLLAGWGRQYLFRATAAPDPLQSLGSLLLLLALLQTVWGSWNFRGIEWSFGEFVIALAPFLPLSVAASVIHPPASAPPTQGLREHYFEVHGAVYSLMALWVALGLVAEAVLADLDLHLGQWVRALGVVLLLVLVRSKEPRTHWAGLCILAALQLVFIATVTPVLD